MEIGDIVRLKQPFKPEPNCLEDYRYGIVVGLVDIDRGDVGGDVELAQELGQRELAQRSPFNEVVLQLYQPETAIVYTDEFGIQPMFYFRMDELEL